MGRPDGTSGEFPLNEDGTFPCSAVHGEPRADGPTPVHMVWLLECFNAVEDTSRGLYWTGQTNRIVESPRGLQVTFDVFKARRIPFDMQDVAEALATAANKAYPSTTSVWRAIAHGFNA